MKARRAIAAIALLAVAAASAGCGSDGQSETTATISKFQFLKQANAICHRSVDEQVAAFQQGLAKSKRSQAAGGADQEELRATLVQPIYEAVQKMIDEVSALGLPEGDEAAAEEILQEFEAGLAAAEADPAVYLTGKAFKKADDAADAYGMNNCGV